MTSSSSSTSRTWITHGTVNRAFSSRFDSERFTAPNCAPFLAIRNPRYPLQFAPKSPLQDAPGRRICPPEFLFTADESFDSVKLGEFPPPILGPFSTPLSCAPREIFFRFFSAAHRCIRGRHKPPSATVNRADDCRYSRKWNLAPRTPSALLRQAAPRRQPPGARRHAGQRASSAAATPFASNCSSRMRGTMPSPPSSP